MKHSTTNKRLVKNRQEALLIWHYLKVPTHSTHIIKFRQRHRHRPRAAQGRLLNTTSLMALYT